MENSNQSLSTIKRKYYALAKEVRGIESRVLRLEEEDEKQRRKLDNLKSKNHQYQDVKEAKHQRWADVRILVSLDHAPQRRQSQTARNVQN